jgi:hypothetical protein
MADDIKLDPVFESDSGFIDVVLRMAFRNAWAQASTLFTLAIENEFKIIRENGISQKYILLFSATEIFHANFTFIAGHF